LLRAGGHIGYGIRPSARGRGLATWALRSVLVRAPALGLGKVLVTCGDSNLASARVIEKAGGVLEDVRETELGLTPVTGSRSESGMLRKTAGDLSRDNARSVVTRADQPFWIRHRLLAIHLTSYLRYRLNQSARRLGS
jgi:Acetyltransferase (GNAT) domain